MMSIARQLYDEFIAPTDIKDRGMADMEAAEKFINELGFDAVEWMQPEGDDDTLICLLFKMKEPPIVISFIGYEPVEIRIYRQVESWRG